MNSNIPSRVLDEDHFIEIHRNAVNFRELQDKYGYLGEPEIKDHLKQIVDVKCDSECLLNTLESRLPFTKWLREYNWKKNLVCDAVAGFTVSVMQIPQGMAYAILAGVQPIVGLYTGFFPTLVYILLGTSPHVSLGTFAVISIILSSAVVDISNTEDCSNLKHGEYCPLQVATAVTFTTGFFQILFGMLQVGKLTNFLSKPLVSGLTCGSAIHVMTSQVKYLFGLKVKRASGYFTVIKTYRELFIHISETNYYVVGISAICILILSIYDNFIKDLLKRVCRFPFPIQLMVVILGTGLSYAFDFKGNAQVEVVGHIPVGLPEPQIPPLELIPKVIPVSVSCGIISYAIHMSLSKMFAQKFSYKVNGSQELFAFGLSNLFGSFFSSLPMSTSLSRSLVQVNSGCKSLFTSGFTAFVLLMVLLCLAPLFESLPTAVLASIIVVSLQGMFLKIQEFVTFSKMSYFDGCIWMTTFLITAFIDVGIGLMSGIGLSLVYLLYQASVPQISIVRPAKGTIDIFISPKEYEIYPESEGSHIFIQIAGNLNFSNAESTEEQIIELISQQNEIENKSIKKTIIIDISGVNSIDPSACKSLIKLYETLEKTYWKTSFVGVKNKVWNQMIKCELLIHIPVEQFYPSMQDAVSFSDKIAHKL